MILGIRTHFDAAHHLPCHEGQCKDLHGHTWHVEVQLQGFPHNHPSSSAGMIMDFKDFKALVKEVIDYIDHKNLNEILPNITPTCENISQWIKSQLTSKGLDIHSVTVQEGEGGYVIA